MVHTPYCRVPLGLSEAWRCTGEEQEAQVVCGRVHVTHLPVGDDQAGFGQVGFGFLHVIGKCSISRSAHGLCSINLP